MQKWGHFSKLSMYMYFTVYVSVLYVWGPGGHITLKKGTLVYKMTQDGSYLLYDV